MSVAAQGRSQALIDHARESMQRLTDVPLTAEAGRTAVEEIDLYWRHVPLTAAIAGEDLATRTRFLNYLAGDDLLSPSRGERAGLVITLARGSMTGLRARRRDASVEELTLPAVEGTPVVPIRVPPPPPVASPAPPPPPPLSLWRRVWVWILRLVGRGPAPAALLPAPPPAPTPGPRPPAPPPPPAGSPPERHRFAARVRTLTDDAAGGAEVERVFIEVAEGPLAVDVAVIDVPTLDGLDRLRDVDGCLLVCAGPSLGAAARGVVKAARAQLPHVFVVSPDGAPAATAEPALVRAGTFAEAALALPELLSTERALRLARRAGDSLRRSIAAVDAEVTSLDAALQIRIQRLEEKKAVRPERFVADWLERLGVRITERVHAILRRASDEAVDRLSRLRDTWSPRIAAATSLDDVRAALTALDEEMPAALADVVARVQDLVDANVTRDVRQIFADTVGSLIGPVPPLADAVPPPPPPVEILTALADNAGRGTSPSRLGALFRSIDAVRTDVLNDLAMRVARLRTVASADLLDREPALRAAFELPLATAARAALDRYLEWLRATLPAEEAAIEQERAVIEPLRRLRSAARDDERRLGELMASVESGLRRA